MRYIIANLALIILLQSGYIMSGWLPQPLHSSAAKYKKSGIKYYTGKSIKTYAKDHKPLATPPKVKGIYVNGYTFTNDKKRAEIVDLVTSTELNTLVLDLKDFNGRFLFPPKHPLFLNSKLSPNAISRKKFVQILKDLNEKGIYTIARVVTFQDNSTAHQFPDLVMKNKNGTIWRSRSNHTWLDLTNEKSWPIPIAKAIEGINLGFDEIQFDYIRYPTDVNEHNIAYANPPSKTPRHKILTKFFAHINHQLKELKVPLSADLFGYTYHKHENVEKVLPIGQRVQDAAQYFDYLSPMIYPSHYTKGYRGVKYPAYNPYYIVSSALKDGNEIIAATPNTKALTRPYLQAFHLGAPYTPERIQAQIRACDEYETAGWILWNAQNSYDKNAFAASEPLPQKIALK